MLDLAAEDAETARIRKDDCWEAIRRGCDRMWSKKVISVLSGAAAPKQSFRPERRRASGRSEVEEPLISAGSGGAELLPARAPLRLRPRK